MPDWTQIVRERLADLALEDDDPAQVFDEVAGHLEENHRSLLNEGCSEEEAVRRTLAGVGDWHVLRKKIESARKKENSMPKRVAQFWLPAFLALLLSMVSLAAMEVFGLHSWVSPTPGGRLRMTPINEVTFPGCFSYL